MPGMLATILNVGLCNRTLHGLIRMTGNTRLAWDLYRRLINRLVQAAGALRIALASGQCSYKLWRFRKP